jgi:hypothetical protein
MLFVNVVVRHLAAAMFGHRGIIAGMATPTLGAPDSGYYLHTRANIGFRRVGCVVLVVGFLWKAIGDKNDRLARLQVHLQSGINDRIGGITEYIRYPASSVISPHESERNFRSRSTNRLSGPGVEFLPTVYTE